MTRDEVVRNLNKRVMTRRPRRWLFVAYFHDAEPWGLLGDSVNERPRQCVP